MLDRRGHEVHQFERDEPPLTADGIDPRVLESDHVVWAASSINPLIAENDPDRVALDLEAFRAFIEAARSDGEGPRTIILSSGGTVYDTSTEPPYSEASPARPRNAYGRAKRELERILLSHDPAGLVLRVSNAYGPGQPVAPGQGVIAHWMHAIALGKDVHIFGDRDAARDFVYVDDIALAVVAVIEQDYRVHDVVNIGAGRPTTLGELLDAVAVTVGTRLEPVVHPARPFDARSTWLDCGRAARTLGWRPVMPLLDGLAATWHAVTTPDTIQPAASGRRTAPSTSQRKSSRSEADS